VGKVKGLGPTNHSKGNQALRRVSSPASDTQQQRRGHLAQYLHIQGGIHNIPCSSTRLVLGWCKHPSLTSSSAVVHCTAVATLGKGSLPM